MTSAAVKRRHGQHDLHGGPEHRPDEERHLAQRHAGSAHCQDRGDEIDPRGQVPTPLTISPSAQKSVAGLRANVRSVSGA